MGISILVIADSGPVSRRVVCENDLGRSRVLCTVADSVFAIGRGLKCGGDYYLIQTRVRNAPIFWTERNAPIAQVRRSKTGLLALKFDERFTEVSDEKKLRLICEISRLVEVEGKGCRKVAAELGISKTWAATLYKVDPGDGRAAKGPSPPMPLPEDDLDWDDEDADDYDEEAGDFDEDCDEDDEGLDEDRDEDDLMRYGLDLDDEFQDQAAEPAPASKLDPFRIPFAAALARRLIRDLERRTDGYGDEIFVESADEHGKPLIWYKQNRQGHFTRWVRTIHGSSGTNIGRTEFVPRWALV